MEDLSARLEQLLSDPQMLSQLGEHLRIGKELLQPGAQVLHGDPSDPWCGSR